MTIVTRDYNPYYGLIVGNGAIGGEGSDMDSTTVSEVRERNKPERRWPQWLSLASALLALVTLFGFGGVISAILFSLTAFMGWTPGFRANAAKGNPTISDSARALLGCILFLIGVALFPRATEDIQPPASPKNIAAQPASGRDNFVHELAVRSASNGSSEERPLSTNARKLRTLWLQLEKFKYDPKFHVLGFDNPFQYGEWRGEVRNLNDQAGKSLFLELGFSPAELLVLGEEYRKNRGLRSEYADYMIPRLDAALNPKKAAKGEGKILQNTTGCADFDIWSESLRQMEIGDFPASNALYEKAACTSIPEGSIVSAPTRRRGYDWLKDKGQFVGVLVRTDQGEKWISEEAISFNNK